MGQGSAASAGSGETMRPSSGTCDPAEGKLEAIAGEVKGGGPSAPWIGPSATGMRLSMVEGPEATARDPNIRGPGGVGGGRAEAGGCSPAPP